MEFYVLRMSKGGRPSKRIGTIQWTPNEWDYKTEDSELAILLDEAKTTETVLVESSFEEDDQIYEFIEEETDATSINFLSGLETLLERQSENQAIWIDTSENLEAI
jgi:hypothetical protein